MKTKRLTRLFFILIFFPLLFSCNQKTQSKSENPSSQSQPQKKEEPAKNPNREKIDEYFKALSKIVIRAENNSDPNFVEKLTNEFNTFTDANPNISELPEWTDADTEKQLDLIDRFVDSTIPPVIYDENEETEEESADSDLFSDFDLDDLGLDDELNYGDLPLSTDF